MTSDEQLLIKKLQQFLQQIFCTQEKTITLKKKKSSRNTHFNFQVGTNNYLIKILTAPLRMESDFYRFEKESELLKTLLKEKNQILKRDNTITTIGSTNSSRPFVPVPKVLHVEPTVEQLGFKYIITEDVAGIKLADCWKNLSTKERLTVVIALAKIFRQLHSHTFTMFGELENYDCPRRFFSFQALLKANMRRNILHLGKQKPLSARLLTNIQLFFEDNLEKARFTDQPHLVHSNLNLQNIIVSTEEKTTVKALLDFEWAYAGDPLFDLFAIAESWLTTKELKKAFFDCYFLKADNFSLENFTLEFRLFKIYSLIEASAIGWGLFPPTEEERVEQLEEKLVELTS